MFLFVSKLQEKFHVRSLRGNKDAMRAALYLQASIISQALLCVTRSRRWCFQERPGLWLCFAFVVAHIVSPPHPAHSNNGVRAFIFSCSCNNTEGEQNKSMIKMASTLFMNAVLFRS